MNTKLNNTLTKVGVLLNKADIIWGVGASMLLHQYNLVEKPTDIDLLIYKPDVEKADKILSEIGNKTAKDINTGIYSTDFFYEYNIAGIDIDMIAGFKINLQNSVYEYKFSKESIPHNFQIKGIPIPFMTLEDWYVLYQLMPNREYKVNLIEGYFIKEGLEYPDNLKNAIEDITLPEIVKKRIRLCLINSR